MEKKEGQRRYLPRSSFMSDAREGKDGKRGRQEYGHGKEGW